MSANEAFTSLEAWLQICAPSCKKKSLCCSTLITAPAKRGYRWHSRALASKAKEKTPCSFYDPVEMLPENKAHFEKILTDFLSFYPFNPELTPQSKQEPTP